jgi:ABC-2 type transport system permease protein
VPTLGGSLYVLGRLLSPRLISVRNTVVRTDPRRRALYAGLAAIGVLFWAGQFGTIYWLFGLLLEYAGDLARILAQTVLEMLLASLFVMLCWSNVITALSTFFLSEDLELVLGLPVSRPVFHYARLVDALAQSSWMMGLFGLPVFLAYGLRSGAPASFYAALLFGIAALLLVAANFGVTAATLLVNLFSPRRTRDLMVFLTVAAAVGLFILLRSLRPERLLNAQDFETLAAYLAEIRVPQPRLFPPRWISEILSATLFYRPFPWMQLGLATTGVLASSAIARWTTSWGFDTGWARSQEARAARFYASTIFDRLVVPFPRAWQPILAKEMRVFVRDPGQWTQIFLLFGICGIYLVSIWALPLGEFSGQIGDAIRSAVELLNLGMGGFVMSAIAARFQFTAVSREGRAWWLLRSGPVDPVTVLRAKSVLGMVPMLFVGEVVVIGSGLMLHVPAALIGFEAGITAILAFGISGIAIAMGAWWPDFRADTAARAASSPAAVFFMVVSLGLVFVVLTLASVTVTLWFARAGDLRPFAALPVAAMVAICTATAIVPVRRAAAALWAEGL